MSSLRSRLGLALVTIALLNGCAGTVPFSACPPWPSAGPAVADEIERALVPPAAFPATWDWLDRLYRLKDQLAVC